jgi:predicted DNA-binding transcriptional regulator YafY
MSKETTAQAQFERITYILPRAARSGGAELEELAELCQVPPKQLLRDLEEVTARAYYHPAGSVDDFRISVDRHQVAIWTKGEFQRPIRLSAREALALGLGLRLLAVESAESKRDELLALARRLDADLAATPSDEFMAHYGVEESAGTTDGLLAFLRDAARDRRECSIDYLKPASPGPEERRIRPYMLVHAEGNWYILAHCHERHDVRAFRLDRIMGVRLEEDTFMVPEEFDPHDHLGSGRLFRADSETRVRVRYSARIARWIEERERAVPEEDGSIVIDYQVADPAWLVRHLLQYGRDAEILEPVEFRELVRDALEGMLRDMATEVVAAGGADR